MADDSLKVCSICDQAKPRASYYRAASNADGLVKRCRQCYSLACQDYRQRKSENIRAQKRAAYERDRSNPEYLAKIKAYQEANKDRKREYDRCYRDANREKLNGQSRRWVDENRDKRLAISRNYKARRRAQEAGGVSTAALAAWTAQQKKVCYWCGCKCAKGFHVDHYVPLCKGGKHDIGNLVIACAPCNLKKNLKDPLDFARQVGRLL